MHLLDTVEDLIDYQIKVCKQYIGISDGHVGLNACAWRIDVLCDIVPCVVEASSFSFC